MFLVAACSSIPKNTQNSCAIFEERYLWYKHAKASYEKWGAPIHLQLAFVKKESDFNWLAKPPRRKLFKVILPKKYEDDTFTRLLWTISLLLLSFIFILKYNF